MGQLSLKSGRDPHLKTFIFVYVLELLLKRLWSEERSFIVTIFEEGPSISKMLFSGSSETVNIEAKIEKRSIADDWPNMLEMEK